MHLFLAAALAAVSARAEPNLRERARAQDYSALPVLRDALQGEDAAARPEAAFALGQLGLLEIPAGDTEPVAAAATRSAAEAALIPAASDPSPGLRRAAVEALGKIGGPDSEPSLLAAATDVDAGVRGEAALAFFRRRFLKRVPDYSTAAVTRLTMLAGDPEAEARWRAVYAFTRWPEPRAEKALAAAQGDDDARVRLFAVRALGKLGVPPDVARLADLDVYVRAEALAALSAAKAWDRIPDAAFSDPSAHVRAAAADAAAGSGDARRFAPLLLKEILGPGTLAPGRALVALAKLRGDAAALDVERARQDPRWWIRAGAYEAASFLPDAEGSLRRGVSDPDPRVASQALETLAASSAPIVDILNGILFDDKATMEMLGTAVEAAADHAAPELVDGLFSAMGRTKGRGTAELREDLRKALLSAASKSPARADEIRRALRSIRRSPTSRADSAS